MSSPRRAALRIAGAIVTIAIGVLVAGVLTGPADPPAASADDVSRLGYHVAELEADVRALTVSRDAAELNVRQLGQRVAELEAALARTDTKLNAAASRSSSSSTDTRLTAASAPAPDAWLAMAACESTGDDDGVAPHRIDKRATSSAGPGYFGALQWAMTTWRDAGGTGDPRDATLELEVDLAARFAARPDVDAAGQWPTCWPAVGRRLGIPR